jgi:hypothetical protein
MFALRVWEAIRSCAQIATEVQNLKRATERVSTNGDEHDHDSQR